MPEEVFKVPTKVILKEWAFLEMVLGSAEVFHLECLGVLLGYITEDSIIAEGAQVVQSAERTVFSVEPIIRRERRIKKISESLGLGLQILGDFHSHTQIGKKRAKIALSGDDIADMKPGWIYIVIAVNKHRGKPKPWVLLKNDKILQGDLEDYSFQLGAYFCYKKSKYKQIPIKCPFATALTSV